MEDVSDMLPQTHKDKIKRVRNANARGNNHPFPLVDFNSVEEAKAVIQSLSHSKIKFDDDFDHDHASGGYGPRGYASFGGGSYAEMESWGSDSEMNGIGFGRGGRGGRGGYGGVESRAGGSEPTGTDCSKGGGSGSPAPGQDGSSVRGRGYTPPQQQQQPKEDTSTDNIKDEATPSKVTETKPTGSLTTTPSQPAHSSTQGSATAAPPAAESPGSTESASYSPSTGDSNIPTQPDGPSTTNDTTTSFPAHEPTGNAGSHVSNSSMATITGAEEDKIEFQLVVAGVSSLFIECHIELKPDFGDVDAFNMLVAAGDNLLPSTHRVHRIVIAIDSSVAGYTVDVDSQTALNNIKKYKPKIITIIPRRQTVNDTALFPPWEVESVVDDVIARLRQLSREANMDREQFNLVEREGGERGRGLDVGARRGPGFAADQQGHRCPMVKRS